MFIKTSCNKCGALLNLDLGDMSRDQTKQVFERLDRNGRECPGGHMELGGLYRMWNLEEVLRRAFDLAESNVPPVASSDQEFVQGLLAQGKAVMDGGQNTVPSLDLPSIHGVPGLRHQGGGNFSNHDFNFVRCDSPLGTRFYERMPRRLELAYAPSPDEAFEA